MVDDRNNPVKIANPAHLAHDERLDRHDRRIIELFVAGLQISDKQRFMKVLLALPGFLVFMQGVSVFIAARTSPTPTWHAWLWMGGGVALMWVPQLWHYWRAPSSMEIVGILKRSGICPGCSYDLSRTHVAADGCTVCAECGGAWKVLKP